MSNLGFLFNVGCRDRNGPVHFSHHSCHFFSLGLSVLYPVVDLIVKKKPSVADRMDCFYFRDQIGAEWFTTDTTQAMNAQANREHIMSWPQGQWIKYSDANRENQTGQQESQPVMSPGLGLVLMETNQTTSEISTTCTNRNLWDLLSLYQVAPNGEAGDDKCYPVISTICALLTWNPGI